MLLVCTLQSVMREFPEARMAYGESDEYSFILHKDTNLYGEQHATFTVKAHKRQRKSALIRTCGHQDLSVSQHESLLTAAFVSVCSAVIMLSHQ
jgi:hypothetical protein